MDGSVATIGFFDGVHRGHQFVIGCLVAEARQRGLQAVVVTFDEHPRKVLSTSKPSSEAPLQPSPVMREKYLLTKRDEVRKLILDAGADRCEVLHFDRSMAGMPAREFMKTVLKEQLGVKVLMMGYDNRFGHRESGSTEGFDDYVRYGQELGIEVKAMPAMGEGISSSAVRHALRDGNVSLAAQMLGRPYSIAGRVVHGYEEGHRLGFPTANIDPASVATMIPATGVYAVEVRTLAADSGKEGEGQMGMMNIGTRPTYGLHDLSLEVHIFDFDGDLYGTRLKVTFLQRIREERMFASAEELRQQLEADREAVIKWKMNQED
ncbi:MAG: riboflavin biosynthesis protein RibF [Prevotella sp.]|nr:riboflavin biosynthesis protein RibF [Prevotella sp.]